MLGVKRLRRGVVVWCSGQSYQSNLTPEVLQIQQNLSGKPQYESSRIS